MTNQKVQYIVIGLAVTYVLYKVIVASNAKPLQKNIDPNNIQPDSISRALNKLTDVGVKVNPTPEETKNAVGK
jgi:hypothetical protein